MGSHLGQVAHGEVWVAQQAIAERKSKWSNVASHVRWLLFGSALTLAVGSFLCHGPCACEQHPFPFTICVYAHVAQAFKEILKGFDRVVRLVRHPVSLLVPAT